MIRKYLCLALLVAGLGACTISYKLNGAAIDYNVYKTINIGNFPIRAAMVYAPLQPMFENELIDVYTKQTRLQIVDSSNADLSLEGEITGYSLSPQAVTDDAYASQTRLTITVRAKYTDHKQPTNSVDQTYSAYRDFDSSEMLTTVQEELCEEITEEIVLLIFNATAGSW